MVYHAVSPCNECTQQNRTDLERTNLFFRVERMLSREICGVSTNLCAVEGDGLC